MWSPQAYLHAYCELMSPPLPPHHEFFVVNTPIFVHIEFVKVVLLWGGKQIVVNLQRVLRSTLLLL